MPTDVKTKPASEIDTIVAFAKNVLDIELFPSQIRLIEMWLRGNQTCSNNGFGFTTALNVYVKYNDQKNKSDDVFHYD